MILLNFSHPVTPAQEEQIETLLGEPIERSIEVATQFDEQAPFLPQVVALVSRVPLNAAQWQSEALVVVLPSLNFIAAALLAELHGRMGYFPVVVRTRPMDGPPRRYEIAEVLDLQAARAAARRRRQE
jgi:hypothetical protein